MKVFVHGARWVTMQCQELTCWFDNKHIFSKFCRTCKHPNASDRSDTSTCAKRRNSSKGIYKHERLIDVQPSVNWTYLSDDERHQEIDCAS